MKYHGYFALAIVIAIVLIGNARGGCLESEFECHDGSCIDKYKRCDGFVDCSGGEDEADCGCGDDEFECDDGFCIRHSLLCNGHSDCSDGEDENGTNCPNKSTTPRNVDRYRVIKYTNYTNAYIVSETQNRIYFMSGFVFAIILTISIGACACVIRCLISRNTNAARNNSV